MICTGCSGELAANGRDLQQLHVGAGMKKLMSGCRALADRPEFRAINNLRSIDAIAVRVWFDRKISTRFPANVLAGFENSAGGTFFNLNDLQVCFWGGAQCADNRSSPMLFISICDLLLLS